MNWRVVSVERRVDKADQPASVAFRAAKYIFLHHIYFFYAITINFDYVLY